VVARFRLMRTPRIACVRAPDFGLAWWLSRHPDRSAQPVVQAEGSGGGASVTAVNHMAGSCDIRPGLTVAQARARAPALHVQVRDTEGERALSRQVVARLQTLTPAVEEELPGLWFVESLGQGRLYGSERNFIRKLLLLLQPFGVPLCVGLAGNRAVARVAAFVSAPGSFTVVPPGQERKFLAALPSHHLAAPSLQHYLRVLGLDTIHQVASVPAAQWAERFGASGEAVQELARGGGATPFAPEALADPLLQSEAFEFPLFCRITLVERAETLLSPLLALLSGRQQAARCVRVTLDLEDGSRTDFVLSLAKPTCASRPFGNQLTRRLSAQPPRSGVRGLVVHVTELNQAPVEQTTLTASTRLAQRQLPCRAEEWRVPRALRAAIPEAGAEWIVPGTERSGAHTRAETGSEADLHCLSSAQGLRLFSPPRRVNAIWSEGTLTALEGPDEHEQVCARKGPWAVSGDWWCRPFDRLYYEVETSSCRYLVFYDRCGGHWYRHGVFD
jgi:protein ImuB